MSREDVKIAFLLGDLSAALSQGSPSPTGATGATELRGLMVPPVGSRLSFIPGK